MHAQGKSPDVSDAISIQFDTHHSCPISVITPAFELHCTSCMSFEGVGGLVSENGNTTVMLWADGGGGGGERERASAKAC